jgi:hypothetical protein
MAYEQWNWSFFGYQRLDGGKPVQDWFDGLPDDAKKEARETIGYLQQLPNHLWKKPHFDPLGGEDVTEIRFETATHTYRIYGYAGGPSRARQLYILLFGHDKKVRNDTKGKSEATKRRAEIDRGAATFHPFEFFRKTG